MIDQKVEAIITTAIGLVKANPELFTGMVVKSDFAVLHADLPGLGEEGQLAISAYRADDAVQLEALLHQRGIHDDEKCYRAQVVISYKDLETRQPKSIQSRFPETTLNDDEARAILTKGVSKSQQLLEEPFSAFFMNNNGSRNVGGDLLRLISE